MRSSHAFAAAALSLGCCVAHAATIGGTVTRSSDGTPLAGADATAYRTSDLQPQANQSTDAVGVYSLSVPPAIT